MSKPDSLLTSAKKLADAAELPWAEVHKFYRDLQAEPNPWLPKSAGRNVWAATPNFISRLLIALASGGPSDARASVEWTRNLTPNGRALFSREMPAANTPAPIEAEFFQYLADPEQAADLISVEFQPYSRRVTFTRTSNGETVWYPAGGAAFLSPARIQPRCLIAGELFQTLSRTVTWRSAGQAPLEDAPDGAADPEA